MLAIVYTFPGRWLNDLCIMTCTIVTQSQYDSQQPQLLSVFASIQWKIAIEFNFTYFAAQSACQNNGGCSQLCVLKPGGRKCLCQAAMKLAADGTSCKLQGPISE